MYNDSFQSVMGILSHFEIMEWELETFIYFLFILMDKFKSFQYKYKVLRVLFDLVYFLSYHFLFAILAIVHIITIKDLWFEIILQGIL